MILENKLKIITENHMCRTYIPISRNLWLYCDITPSNNIGITLCYIQLQRSNASRRQLNETIFFMIHFRSHVMTLTFIGMIFKKNIFHTSSSPVQNLAEPTGLIWLLVKELSWLYDASTLYGHYAPQKSLSGKIYWARSMKSQKKVNWCT